MTENEIGRELTVFETKAKAVVISDDAEYNAAAEMCKEVKKLAKKVKDYWEPLRVSAKAAYDEVLARKKEMTDPLDAAEKQIKKAMSDYTVAVEKERRAKEEELRRIAREEAERKLAEAAAADQSGDEFTAEFALMDAEMYADAAKTISVAAEKPNVSGVSTRKSWKIKSIDLSKVPINFDGVCIRPVDESAVMKLIKASNGEISIPGIEIEEEYIMSVRAS